MPKFTDLDESEGFNLLTELGPKYMDTFKGFLDHGFVNHVTEIVDIQDMGKMRQFNQNEKLKYQYNPKLLSYDLYGTPELWYYLLRLNNMNACTDLVLDHGLKVFTSADINRILNTYDSIKDN